jgi:hypothetical protein
VHGIFHVAETTDGVGVRRADDLHAGRDGDPHVVTREIESIRKSVDLQGHASFQGCPDRALEVERVLGPVPDQPSRRVAQATYGGVAHGLDDPCGELGARRALPLVQRELHPLQLGEHIVRKVE